MNFPIQFERNPTILAAITAAIPFLILILVRRGQPLGSVPELVLSSFDVQEKGDININIEGRRRGLLVWLASFFGLNTSYRMQVTPYIASNRERRLTGVSYYVVPLSMVEQVLCDYSRNTPGFLWRLLRTAFLSGAAAFSYWFTAPGAEEFLGFPRLLPEYKQLVPVIADGLAALTLVSLIAAIVFFATSKTIEIKVGNQYGFRFHRTKLLGARIDYEKATKAVDLITNLILSRQLECDVNEKNLEPARHR